MIMRSGIIALAVLLVGCANLSLTDVYQSPTFEYQSTSIRDVSFTELSGRSVISISNPNPYQLPISQLGAELWLEGRPWLSLDNSAVSGLPASQSVAVDFNWELVFDQLLSRASQAYQQGEADFTLKLAPTVNVPVLGPQTLSWSSTFTVPVPKAPSVSLRSWSLSSASLTKVSLNVDLAINNPNSFAVVTDNLKLDVGSGSSSFAQLGLSDAQIKARGTSVQTVELTLNLVDTGLALFSGLKSGQWPDALAMNWQGNWNSPDLDFALPALSGLVKK
jgi:LEA14-like dessication related protein